MSTAIPIILIVVVWLFVLAPWILNSQRPMGRTGEAFEETRVLFEGDSGKVEGRRRPRVSAKDLRRRDPEKAEEDYEIVPAAAVEAEEVEGNQVADAEQTSEQDTPAAESVRETSQKDKSVPETVEGEVVEDDDILLSDDEEQLTQDSAQALAAESEQELKAESKEESKTGSALSEESGHVAAANSESFHVSVAAEVAEDAYELDDSYTSPADLLYPGAVDEGEVSAVAASEKAAASGAMLDRADLVEETGVASEADGYLHKSASDDAEDTDLSDEELAFAQRRLGRGGWDPVAAKKASAGRFQRRQRTLIGLAIAVVITVALGIVLGGWTWWLAGGVGVVGVIYLVALRNQVRHEQQLLRRRVRQLRRARLGVRNAEDEALAVPRNLRRPGAVVLEIDDDSPDFDHLPLRYSGEDFDGQDTTRRRRSPRRDDLAARRVG